MYKGEPTNGIDFYTLLYNSDEFTTELGKVNLASGRLEAELIIFFIRKEIKEKYNNATLGKLINIGKENNLFNKNLLIALQLVKEQRNYLTHNIYALFTNLIDETILNRKNLIDTDVIVYIDKTFQLNENLKSLADIIKLKQ